MAKYQVTFKGPAYDVTVSGDSAEEIVRDYDSVNSRISNLLKSNSGSTPRAGSKKNMTGNSSMVEVEQISVADLSIPQSLKEHFVEQRNRLTNWDTLFFLLHYAPDGLTNRQIRVLSEELGKPISYSWLDTEFHRKRNQGRVISRRPRESKETLYFLAEPGKKDALKLIDSFDEK
jgi:hypothetical protein